MRILWIKTSPLHPLTRGGDLRTFHLLRHLHQRHEVTFVGMTADAGQVAGAQQAGEFSTQAVWAHEPRTSLQLAKWKFLAGALFNLTSSLPYAVARFRSNQLRRLLTAKLKEERFDVVVADFLFPAASLPWELKAASKCPWVLFQHNVESMIWRRRAEGKTGAAALYYQGQRDRMLRFERQASRRFDGVLAVSEEDARIFKEEMQLSNVLGVVPTGVDLDYFQSVPRSASAVPTVVFMGSMDWYANVDGVKWFVEAVWPLVQRQMPQARFVVVGRKPPPEILALATSGRNIEVTGTVPDVRPFLRGADVIVVPLRIGGGTRLKIYEAMAAEVPVVSTRIGAEGLSVEDGLHVLLADSAEDTAAQVLKVLRTPVLAAELARHALEEVARPCSWAAAAQIFEAACVGLRQQGSVS
ncbi:MAG: glycosyltransferase family 4 protein [Prosthecobacter sp.]|uniref:glycosyltransferase n=1 Tax=Prosthecobacter sp. TaxID=1965333 RepID=UPI0025FAD6AA|nr:glycosyltransferase [Prosthecobacter sp.]MCF7785106.1 glycosyltransferase family 4 protein [Prosthecobacter sp.]